MKTLKIYQVDAFASKLFSGNPAAVCPLDEWLADDLMQSIAQENNLSETAFIVKNGEEYNIRWFTPNTEVELCGHATLASAFVIFEKLGHKTNEITFTSLSGILKVQKNADYLTMDFPALNYNKIDIDPELQKSLKSVKPTEVYETDFDVLLTLDSPDAVAKAELDLHELSKLKYRGLILTSHAAENIVYSRCFYPGCDVPEDPVTGSAHCVIAPYWCEKLNIDNIQATQGKARTGELTCSVKDKRVFLTGKCCMYMEAEIFIP